MDRIDITEGIYLRGLELSDAPEMFRTINTQRSYLGRWLPFVDFTQEVTDSQAFIKSVVEAPSDKKELVFAIIADEQFAGTIGFKDTDKDNKRTEIGYWLGEDYQGRGLITLAADALCCLAFNELDINRIQIKCAVGNIRSSNIPRRLGFVFEGVERDGEIMSNGKFRDVEVFSLLKKEYKGGGLQ